MAKKVSTTKDSPEQRRAAQEAEDDRHDHEAAVRVNYGPAELNVWNGPGETPLTRER